MPNEPSLTMPQPEGRILSTDRVANMGTLVGGPLDGQKHAVPVGQTVIRVALQPDPPTSNEVGESTPIKPKSVDYVRTRLYASGAVLEFWRWNESSELEALSRLIAFYRVPVKK